MDDVRHAGFESVTDTSAEFLEQLFIREYAKVVRLIGRIVRDQAHAEDLAVEVFSKVLRPNLDIATACSVLYRQAVRTALDEVRRRNRRHRIHQLFSPFLAGGNNPEKEYAAQQRELRVGLILKRMHRRDAELLILRAEGLSYAELANALNLKPTSIGAMLSRAQSAFRKEYLKQYGQPD